MITGLGIGIAGSSHKFAASATPDRTQAIDFDQADYLKLASPGFSDTKTFTLSAWFYSDAAQSSDAMFLTAIGDNRYSQDGLQVYFTSSGIEIRGRGSDNNYKLRASCDDIVIQANHWYHLACSFDLSDSSKRHVFINGQDQTEQFTFPDYSNTNLDFTRGEMAVGHSVTTGQLSSDGFDGEIGDFYLSTSYLDLVDNIEKFITPDGVPADLGSNGSTPSGSQPEIYLSGDVSQYGITNIGSLGNFTASGTLADAGSEPVRATGVRGLDPDESLRGGTNSITNSSTDTQDITISFWIKDGDGSTAAASGADTLFRLLHSTGGTSLLGAEYQGGRLRLMGLDANVAWAFDYLIGTYNATYGNGTYDDGYWHHLVYSRNGATDTEHLYVDGVSTSFTVNANRQNFDDEPTVWQGTEFSEIAVLSESYNSANSPVGSSVCYIFVDNSFIDISQSSNLEKFYKNDGFVNLGSDGTASGLSAPVFYHEGDAATFLTAKGRTDEFDYTLTESGTGVDLDVDDTPRYTFRSRVPISVEDGADISTSQSKFGSSSLEVDGTQDAFAKFDQPDINSTGAFTMEGWFYPTSVSGVRYVFGGWGGGNGVTYIRQNGSTLQIKMGTTKFGNNIFNDSTIGTGLSANTWYHVAVTWDGTTYRTFLDGTLGATTSSSTEPFDGTGLQFSVGTVNGTTQNFIGYCDEFRLSDDARYTAAFTPSTSAFENDPNTKLLLHFEGYNGETATRDDNGNIGR